MKILTVEDDPVSSMVLESSLRQMGHELVNTKNGAEAWAVIEREPLRVVVSDWNMPQMDGLELCRRIRGREGDYVYFILLTSRSISRQNREAALAAGVDDFLTKPMNFDELWMRLRVAERILQYTTEVKQLESFLPICGYCKKIRDDSNYWQQIEQYFHARSGTKFSHGVCPDCMEKMVKPQLDRLGIKMPPSA